MKIDGDIPLNFDEYDGCHIEIHGFKTEEELLEWAEEHIKPDYTIFMNAVFQSETFVENTLRQNENTYIEIGMDFNFESIKEAVDWMDEHIKPDSSKIMKIVNDTQQAGSLDQGLQSR